MSHTHVQVVADQVEVESPELVVDASVTADASEASNVEVVQTANGPVRVIHNKVKSTRERATALVNKDVMERIRSYVFWTPGCTMQEFVEEAVNAHLTHIEKKNGGAYKAIPEGKKLKTGRRMSSDE